MKTSRHTETERIWSYREPYAYGAIRSLSDTGSDPVVVDKIASWMRTAVGIVESSHIRVMRVADNMRNVAVTEGDKVEAQIKFGWEVDAYPVNEIAEFCRSRIPVGYERTCR